MQQLTVQKSWRLAWAPVLVLLLCGAVVAGAPIVYTKFPDYLPGYLIQIPALALAYAYVVRYRLLDTYRFWMPRGVLLLSFIVPLQNVFLLKAFRKYFLGEYLGLEIFRPSIMLLIVLAGATLATRRRARIHPIVAASFAIGCVGWIIATIASQNPALSIASGFFEFLCPYLAVYVIAANAPDRDFLLHCNALFVVAFLLVTISQAAGTVGSIWSDQNVFGIPIFADEFLEIKKNLPLMVAIGGNGYGNTDNYISLWSLAVPLMAGLYYVHRRAVWIAAFYAALYCGLLVYSRSGLLAVMTGIAALGAYRVSVLRKTSGLIWISLALIIAIHSPPSSIAYMRDGAESFLNSLQYAANGTGHADVRRIEKQSRRHWDASGVDRMEAMQRGIEIAEKHPATGIGYGSYAAADPELTAPHNMLILRFAEGGVLSFASLLLLIALPILAAVKLLRTGSTDAMRIACTAALGSFMLKAAVFGATFSIGGQIPWGYAVALMIVSIGPEPEHA